jgi:catechol 2,3-dioxygenase-like lactoylglutathione lyase family enzyme
VLQGLHRRPACPSEVPDLEQPLPHLGGEMFSTMTGATGPFASVYIRDPDGNLVEIANPLPE